MSLQPSTYQHAIYDWARHATGSAAVIAVAGSGKTTTLCELVTHIPARERVRFFAFNKQIADTLKGRLGWHKNVDCGTFHSAGYRAILSELRNKVDTDSRKMRTLLQTTLHDTDRRAYGDELLRLVSLGKAEGIGVPGMPPDVHESWAGLIDHHDLDFLYLLPPHMKAEDYDEELQKEKARVVFLAQTLLKASNDAALVPFEWAIDFDDQLYLPLLWDLPLPQYDWVLVDEAQDTNRVQREFLKRSLKPGGRMVAVGDPRQAIYAWRGASHDAVDLLMRDFQMVELPLSICYRCARSIVAKAQTLVSQIEAAPGALEGVVDLDAPPSLLEMLPPEAAILCRNNAPLVKQAYKLLAKGKGCRILGRDIGKGLVILLERMRTSDVDECVQRLQEYQRRECLRHRKAGNESKAQGVEDRVACLLTVIDNLGEDNRTLDGAIAAIEQLFGDEQKGVLTLSTIHKAKGLEWPIVAIIASYLLPSHFATKDWQIRQEENLQYVAWTRARERLIVIDDTPEWLKKKKQAKERDQERGDVGEEQEAQRLW